jgi:hypothetical protein
MQYGFRLPFSIRGAQYALRRPLGLVGLNTVAPVKQRFLNQKLGKRTTRRAELLKNKKPGKKTANPRAAPF